jgi:hypothetical protein
VGWPQTVAGALLVVLLVAVSAFFLGQQVQVLRQLRRFPRAEDEDRRVRRQTYRRLVTSGLLLVLGVLLAMALLYLEAPAQQLADYSDAQRAAGREVQLTDFGRLYAWFWIVFLLILMAVVFLAAFDLWATRRHGLRERRRIQADRRAMLEEQLGRLRRERNGHG